MTASEGQMVRRWRPNREGEVQEKVMAPRCRTNAVPRKFERASAVWGTLKISLGFYIGLPNLGAQYTSDKYIYST